MLDAGAWGREFRVRVGMNGRSRSRGSAGVVVGNEPIFVKKRTCVKFGVGESRLKKKGAAVPGFA